MTTTLVLGVGNTLLSDDGAGVHVLRHLATYHRDLLNTRFLDAGTLSFTLLADIEVVDNLVVLDAARFGGRPGDVRVFAGSNFDNFLKSGRLSVHEVGFSDLMDMARLQECLPDNRALVGVEPGRTAWGDTPGDAVRRAIPEAANLAAGMIRQWHMEDTQKMAIPA